MLDKMCETRTTADAASVDAFAERFVERGEMEEQFYAAIRDFRKIGFKEGMRAALQLFAEVR